jgi:Ca2+/Na+ antiporter
VDGNETRVGVTVVEEAGTVGERDLTVAFAYARGADIVHDPTFGFLRTITEAIGRILGNPVFYALGAVAAGAVFGMLAVGRRGRKVKRA